MSHENNTCYGNVFQVIFRKAHRQKVFVPTAVPAAANAEDMVLRL